MGKAVRKCDDRERTFRAIFPAVSWLLGVDDGQVTGRIAENPLMKHAIRPLPVVCALLASLVSLQAQAPAKHAMTSGARRAVQRVGEPQISPDGRAVVYTLGATDMDTNRIAHNIWIAATAPGSKARQLTQSGHDTRPQWSPDGK